MIPVVRAEKCRLTPQTGRDKPVPYDPFRKAAAP